MKTKLLALFMMLSLASHGQSLVKGRVIDENDQGLPGVSVLIKGTTVGSVTDVEGNYSINAPADAILLFSFIGYTTQEVAVAGRTTLDIKLQPDFRSLDEVVVIGYGTTTTKELTGAVSAVRADDITKLNTVRLDQALQGQMAGVQITQGSGSPGGAVNIRIRGLTTNGDNNPLVLIDGIPYPNPTEALNALNPNDIESVNVLKDGTAGIYGVQAANGVIIITTRQGVKGAKPRIEFNAYYGTQQTAKKLNLLNAREFAILKNEAHAAGGQLTPYNNVDLGKGTDWQNEVFQKAPIRQYSLNLTGGGDKSTYSIGGSMIDQEGIVGGDKASYRRYNARINATFDIHKNVKLTHVLLYANEHRKTLPEFGISSVLFNTINANPISSTHMPDGRFSYLEDVAEIINPLAQMHNTHNNARVNKITGKEEITYTINEHLDITGRAGYNAAIVDSKSFNPLVWYGAGKAMNSAINENLDPRMTVVNSLLSIPVYNSINETRDTYLNYNFEAFVNYNRTFHEHHKVKGTLGASAFGELGQSLSGTGFNVPYGSTKFADISASEGTNLLNTTSSWQNESRLQSFFLRAEYGFQNKYLFSAIMRRDGSTRFGANNRFGYFPAASAAWVVTEESFFNIASVDFLKVRASYGVSGNDKIGDWRYRGLLNGEGVYPFNDQLTNGVAFGVLSNPDLKWESTAQTNVGVDLTLWNGKVSITTDYYVKKTSDLIFQPDLSALSGAYGAGGAPPFVNGGDVKNSGFEFLINYSEDIGNDFSFNIGYNLTTIKNTVTGLQQGVDFYQFGSFGVGGMSTTRMQVGYPMGYFFGYKTDGVYQTNQEISERGIAQPNAQAGDLRYKDLDGNNEINFSDNSDKTIIGSPIPDVIMGLNVGVAYKGFDLSAMLYASIGNEIIRNYERQQPLANMLDYKINRWTGEGSNNAHPRLTTAGTNNGVLSDYFVEDGSFLRIKNVQLGYTLPKNISEKIGATKVRVYVAANNLVTFTKYMGFDPEFSSYNPNQSGVDLGYYPQAKNMMAGINFNF